MGDDLEIASRLRNLASAWGGLPLLIKAAERLEELAGPPEPSEEEVARAWLGWNGGFTASDMRAAARVQALYSSRRA